jgi:hypothetical protein
MVDAEEVGESRIGDNEENREEKGRLVAQSAV